MRKSYPIALVVMFLALLPAWFGIGAFNEARGFEARTLETTGTITRYQGYPGAGGSITGKSFIPMVLFELEDGVWAEVPANQATKDDVGKIGTEVSVLYDPAETSHVRFTGFYSLYGAAVYFAVPVVLLLLLSIYLLPQHVRAPNQTSGVRVASRSSPSVGREA